MSFAFVFPGQGSQSVGMLAALAEAHPVVRATFDEASGVLGYDLWSLVQSGPQEALNRTECTQPAMLVAGVATFRAWRAAGGQEPSVVAGHSLGEFTALACAGALDFGAAADLVRYRGQAMQEAVPADAGAMAAVLGLDDADVEAACAEAATAGIVEAVNFNSPGQVVIAGERVAVERAIEAARQRGAKRAVILPVSVPSHSRLMRPAGERLAERLAGLTLRAPRIRYVSAVNATSCEDPQALKELLVRQIASPVRWSDTVRALVAAGARQVIECGPGKVLVALGRRIDKREGLQHLAIDDPASLDAALAATRGG
jgi:[acyl-carrier-protein] S-malonyltransferase